MKIDVYIAGEKVCEIDCPYYEKYSDRSNECKHDVPPCKHIPKDLYIKYKRLLDLHQAYGFLCYLHKENGGWQS